MTAPIRLNMKRTLRVLVHGLGLSSLGSALFLQSLVFFNIFQNGYFRGVEQNRTILNLEIGLTGIAIAYFVYIFIRFVSSNQVTSTIFQSIFSLQQLQPNKPKNNNQTQKTKPKHNPNQTFAQKTFNNNYH